MRFRDVSILIAFALLCVAQSAGAQNLIADPTFSSGVSAWATRGEVPQELEWSGAPGADGAPGFGRLTALLGGPGTFFATVCLPVSTGTTYSWGGFLRLAEPAEPQAAQAALTVLFFGSSDCSGPPASLDVTTAQVVGSIRDDPAWYLRSGPDVVAPPGALSVAFEIRLSLTYSGAFTVDFDNVYFGPQGTGPPMAAVGVPTVSEVAFWVFAVLLALAGAWRIVKV
jgi:hypothetical protein